MKKQMSVFGPAALAAMTAHANGTGGGGGTYVPPSVSGCVASPLALKPKVVRWRPLASRGTAGTTATSNGHASAAGGTDVNMRHAVIGSYGEGENTLTVRAVDTSDHTERDGDAKTTRRGANNGAGAAAAVVERVGPVLARTVHDGDVNDLRFCSGTTTTTGAGARNSGSSSSSSVHHDLFATASSNGSVYLYALGPGGGAPGGGGSSNGKKAVAMADDADDDVKTGRTTNGGFVKPKPKTPGAAAAATAAGSGASSSSASASASSSLSLSLVHAWKGLHSSSGGGGGGRGAATCVDYQPATHALVSGGEDGSVHVLSPDTTQQLLAIPNAHSGSIYAVRWTGPNTLLSCGMSGRLTAWDTRAPPSAGAAVVSGAGAAAGGGAKHSQHCTPSYVCEYKPPAASSSGGAASLTCAAVHPSRPDTVATGTSDGVLCVWDVRLSAQPIAALQVHVSVVWDVVFLPALPTALVTCGDDGVVCLTDFNAHKLQPSAVTFGVTGHSGTGSGIQQTVLYRGDGLSVNSIDVDARAPHPHTLLCASDTSALLCAQHFFLRDA